MAEPSRAQVGSRSSKPPIANESWLAWVVDGEEMDETEEKLLMEAGEGGEGGQKLGEGEAG
jgi:hypothetical protein